MKPCFIKLFRIFFSKWGGSYMTNTGCWFTVMNGRSQVTFSNDSRNWRLLEPWSQIKTFTERPILVSLSIQVRVRDWSVLPVTGPALKNKNMPSREAAWHMYLYAETAYWYQLNGGARTGSILSLEIPWITAHSTDLNWYKTNSTYVLNLSKTLHYTHAQQVYLYLYSVCLCVCVSVKYRRPNCLTDHDQIWHAYADRPGDGSYLKKIDPPPKGGRSGNF